MLRDLLYTNYANKSSIFRKIYRNLLSTPLVARALFGIKIVGVVEKHPFFDLTTVLMRRHIARKLRKNPHLKLLEIGAGGYAILSGSLSRLAANRIDATELETDRVENAQRHIDANKYNVRLVYADMVPNPESKPRYDIVFWNLPYYSRPEEFLKPLFERMPNVLSDNGELIIGYNSKPLAREAILPHLRAVPELELREVITYRWNLHEILIIGRRSRAAQSSASGGAAIRSTQNASA